MEPQARLSARFEPAPPDNRACCLAEFAFAPQTADSDGDFVQGILTRDQYEVIES